MDIRNTNLEPGNSYHIFNRGINGMPVFFEERNFSYFLSQYHNFVYPFAKTFAYCLMRNHFHFLIRVRDIDELPLTMKLNLSKPYYWHVSNGFSSFLKGYTRGINKTYNRTGPLFESPFKRIEVDNEDYYSKLIAYIHINPQKHGVIGDFRNYPHSSYQTHLSTEHSKLERNEVVSWLGGAEQYERFHLQSDVINMDSKLFIE